MSLSHSPRIITSGLVLALDAADRNSFISGSSTWNDLSCNGSDSTFVGNYSYSNGSIVFDGSGSRSVTNSYITYGNNTTWEVWINRTVSVNAYNMFIGRYLPYFAFHSNYILFSNNINGGQYTFNSYALPSPDGRWFHIVCSTMFDGTATTSSIYVNGIFNNRGATSGSQVNYANHRFHIGDGGLPNQTWYPFSGSISNVKVYNRTLSASEILQNYNAMKGRFGL